MNDIAVQALDRIAHGLPAFNQLEPARSQLELARRRDALKWLRQRGYIVATKTGERGVDAAKPWHSRRWGSAIRRPVATDFGREYLATARTLHPDD